jgi:hypothetical protein
MKKMKLIRNNNIGIKKKNEKNISLKRNKLFKFKFVLVFPNHI